jgi:hypothetical protein
MTAASGVFAVDELDELVTFFDANGYATVRDAFSASELARAEDAPRRTWSAAPSTPGTAR